MAKPVLIFALRRSGGSYVSQILSNGLPIWSEPRLPDDGFVSTLTENVRRLQDFQTKAPTYQVVKVCDYAPYLDLLADRKLSFPNGMKILCLFRDPVKQIASDLFTFHTWDDPWTPRQVFWDKIAEYRRHAVLCRAILNRIPSAIAVRYEDTVGSSNLSAFLNRVYGAEGPNFLSYAQSVAIQNFALGPIPDGEYEAVPKVLLKKEEFWIKDKLADVMGVLGYGG